MEGLDRIDVEIGRRVRDARKRADLSQRALGDRIGLTQQQVLKYESGQSRMAIATLCRIADALGVPPAELVRGLSDGGTGDTDLLALPERELVAAYRSLPEGPARAALVEAVKLLSSVARG